MHGEIERVVRQTASTLFYRPTRYGWQDRLHATALHVAAESGRLEIVRLLLAANADPTAKDSLGQTARERAARNKIPGRVECHAVAALLQL